jgi:meiotically up-regulated gene 157 (Mug157) protein
MIIDKNGNEAKCGYDAFSEGHRHATKEERETVFEKRVKYRGYNIDVFCDDNGQQEYWYFKGSDYSGGSFNPCWEEELEYTVDEWLKNHKKEALAHPKTINSKGSRIRRWK